VNAPPVGSVLGGKVYYFGVRPAREAGKAAPSTREPSLLPAVCPDVFLLRVFPGMNPEIFEALPALGTKGVVIEGYGVGSIPFLKRDLLPGVKRLLERGIAVAITTQSLFDGTDLSLYEVGKKCLAMGAVEGRDMAVESLVAKLMWALGRTTDPGEVRGIMATNFAGEVTPEGETPGGRRRE
jgi:L-asparaginase